MRRSQGSLEYIILIAGIVVMGVVAYFVAKGIMSSSKEEINETTVNTVNSMRGEINNIENI